MESLIAAKRQVAISEEQLRVARENLATERFTKAVAEPGDHSPDVRIGGIFSLANIPSDDASDGLELRCSYCDAEVPFPGFEFVKVFICPACGETNVVPDESEPAYLNSVFQEPLTGVTEHSLPRAKVHCGRHELYSGLGEVTV